MNLRRVAKRMSKVGKATDECERLRADKWIEGTYYMRDERMQ